MFDYYTTGAEEIGKEHHAYSTKFCWTDKKLWTCKKQNQTDKNKYIASEWRTAF